jgi:hypothetical protein
MPLEEIEHCDVFYPTMSQFSNFAGYLEKIAKISRSGIFKVIILRYNIF